MKFLSLFSGVEAASVAWEPLGFECLGVCENSPFPSAVLAHRYPKVHNFGDVTTLTKEKYYETATEKPDIIIGGSPCQAFSVAGARAGTEDPRGRLMYDFIRIVSEVEPHYIVWENVKGALSSNEGKDFGTLIGSLDELGYDLEWTLLDTRDFGLPQSRARVYLVGHLRGGSFRPILPNEQINRRSQAKNREAGLEPTKVASGCVKVTSFDPQRWIGNGRSIVGCLCARDYKGLGSDCVPMGKVVVESQPEGVRLRRLTPIEYERLQGFPDDWTKVPWRGKTEDHCPDGHRYKAMGNTMSVPVVKWIGQQIKQHNGGEK